MDNCFINLHDQSRQTPEKDVLYILPVGLTGPAKRQKKTSCIHYWLALPVPPNARKRRPVYTTHPLPLCATNSTNRQKKTSCIHYRSALPVPPNARKIRPVYTTGRPYRSRQMPEKDVLYILPVLYRSARPIPPIAPKRRPLYSTGRPYRSRQTPEKDVLYKLPAGPVTECAFVRWRIVLTFLSRQRDVIASFSFGAKNVQTCFYRETFLKFYNVLCHYICIYSTGFNVKDNHIHLMLC